MAKQHMSFTHRVTAVVDKVLYDAMSFASEMRHEELMGRMFADFAKPAVASFNLKILITRLRVPVLSFVHQTYYLNVLRGHVSEHTAERGGEVFDEESGPQRVSKTRSGTIHLVCVTLLLG